MDDATHWYEAQRPGLGTIFLREVSRAFEVVVEHPRMWPVWPGWSSRTPVRRFVLQRFPFSIAYVAQRQRVVILAVAHGRRRPGYWRSRAKQ
ncbi:type II toxin-antitoxin system RelE/ParE family toxin [Candidatus Binatus sp.]|uniref:type II toxin-antitoxin system RelE/ParE family toxin n=1 Tax=Candidatus Binatus sp. TaxID=2811406 RepID=UPI003CC67C52